MKLPMKFRYYIKHPLHLWYDLTNPLKWAWQRVFRGWDDRVIWSIDGYLSEMMPQWLRRLKEEKAGIPFSCFEGSTTEEIEKEDLAVAEKKWHAILDTMIAGFEAGKKLIDYDFMYDDIEEFHKQQFVAEVTFNRGMDAFKEHYFSLWD